jgi:SAM-dependent methyltransferase
MNGLRYYFRDTCRMCDSNQLTKIIGLTPTPPGNDFLTESELGINEFEYPLDLYFCLDCYHVQLGHVVDPKILYQKNYTYVSGTSSEFVLHLKTFAQKMIKDYKLKSENLVIDIGSNDGTCLSFFKEAGLRVLGIDPAQDIAQNATKNGIETIGDFFSYDLAINLKRDYGGAKLITSHNACAHIDDLLDIVKGVNHLLENDGVFVVEVGYFVDVYNNTWFDTIYHEHLDFHTLAPFEKLFKRVGMEMIGAERISPQGGSIRIFSQKLGGKLKKDSSIGNLIALENSLGLNQVETFHKFNKKINVVKKDLKKLVKELKNQGKTIAGFGAPTKATTLMQHFDLNAEVLDFIVDDNPLKQGLYSPISHIPIFSSDVLYDLKPDYVLILAWNFAKPIMNAHIKYSTEIGQFIVPMPSPQIIE